MNNFGSYPILDPTGSGQFEMFLTYVIKVDTREVPRLYYKHIHVLLLFLVSQENYPYAVKVNHFGSYPSFGPLDQANLRCFQ